MSPKWLTTPVAILLGSIIISISVLIGNGVIIIKGLNTNKLGSNAVSAQVAGAQAPQPVYKTEAQIVEKLKEYAGKLGLDQNKFNSCLDSGSKASLVKADGDEGVALGVQGTPSFYVNGRPMLRGAVPFSEFKTILDEELTNPPAGGPTNTERKTVAVGNLPYLGKADAKVTFIEFSDYQCPFCGRYYKDTENQIIKQYVDTGKIKFYYRDFPLTQIHPGAQKGAEAARCAGDQNKYWEYHNLVFENQSDIF